MKSKAFTLIELLVVISIIGVISSIVLVSFSGSRDKARLAKAQNFDAQISHALGAYAVGIWRFEDDISDGEVSDESGYGNNGTIHGNPVLDPDGGIYAGTEALKFDGNGDYVEINDVASHIAGSSATFSAWVKGPSQHHRGIVPINTSSGGNKALFMVYDNKLGLHDGTWHNGTAIIADDKWHHVAYTYNTSNGATVLYVDGKIDKNLTKNINYSSNDKVSIGQEWDGGSTSDHFVGTIDDVSIYNEALSSAQIQQHFAAGAPSHGIAMEE